jgi:hypothetical protein
MTDNIYYVYEYIREDTTPYYIGKGCGYRISDKKHSVIVPGKQYRKFVGKHLTEVEAYELEGFLTHKYGLLIDGTGILENKIHGGGNISPEGFTGKHHSAYSKEKISNGNLGKVRTAEHKINYSKPKSVEHADKIRQANIGRQDDGRNAKISATKKGKPWTQACYDARNIRKNKV